MLTLAGITGFLVTGAVILLFVAGCFIFYPQIKRMIDRVGPNS